jgi:hypothetical protein
LLADGSASQVSLANQATSIAIGASGQAVNINTSVDGCLQIFYSGGSGANTAVAFYRGATLQGSIVTTGATTSYTSVSDRHLKTDIVPTRYGLAEVMRIDVSDFSFLTDEEKVRHTGFIAQQLGPLFPDAVTAPTEALPYWLADYGRITPLLVRAIQEQQQQIEALQKGRT